MNYAIKNLKVGQLYGNINLDTIGNKINLYGLGPVEYLAGEILIIDGKSYKSTVVTDTTMKVEETYNIKAPFFGYANVAKWTEQTLPDSILTIQQLEQCSAMPKGGKLSDCEITACQLWVEAGYPEN